MARLLQLFTAHQADFFQNSAFPDKTATTGHFGTVFEDSGDPFAAWDGRMPPTYNNGNITLILHWASLTVTSGNCRWDAAFERLDEDGQSLLSSGFAADQPVTSAASSTANALVYSSIAFSNAQADGVQAGESFRIRITRDTTDAADTMVGDAFLLNIGVLEA